MTFEQWAAEIVGALREAGFRADYHQGFPIVRNPIGFQEKYRLLKWSAPYSVEKRIYAEGMLFVPIREK